MYVLEDCLDLSHCTDFTFCFQRVADFIMEAVADSPQLKAMVARFINEMNENLDSAERIHKPAKRNSELLNSLLGKYLVFILLIPISLTLKISMKRVVFADDTL